MFDVASAHGQVEDLSGAHEDALERGTLPGLVEPFDRVDHEGCGDLVELSRSDLADEVALEAALFILVGNDATSFEAAPKLECIAKCVPRRRFLTDLLFLFPRKLTGLRKCQGGEVTEEVISDLSVLGNSEDETFGASWLNFY